jgi:DNA-binding NarL/FixJ family response regulator
MSSTKIMIVDDSPFSRTILAETLTEASYEVVGEADCLDSLLETYVACKPDIVTMDIAMPGADGFECTKALRLHDSAVKVILCSSMKDEELEAEARRVGAAGYVQKPVDVETISRIIGHIMSPDELFVHLENWSLETFKEGMAQSFTRMTKTAAAFLDTDGDGALSTSRGITVVIGIIGRYPGSFILDISLDTAEKMAAAILKREAKNRDEVVAMAAEYANVVAGVACSMLNKREKTFGLKVAPPSVFYGGSTEIVSPNIQVKGAYAETDYGQIYIGVGFKKGTDLWM